ncbi:MAG: metalloprotease RseP, partial [Bacteroidota bacterium]
MDILIRLGQLFLALSILVILHEFGHFFFAKLFKTRVEKFYLFFDPWFSLIKFKRGDTEYGIGWLPLGGYVKISGMIDESMDKEQLAKPAEPWEFRAKPAWQRLLIMTGGVLVNFLLAFVIYILSLYSFGEEYLPTSQAKDGIYIEGALKDIGFQNGDQIVAIDGKPVTDVFQKIKHDILFSKDRHIEFVRDGQKMDLNISDAQISELIAEKRDGIFAPRLPFFVGSFAGGSLAQKAGLKENDKLTGINDKTLRFFDEFVSELQGLKSQKIVLHFERENKPMQIDVQLDDTGKIGVAPQSDLSKLFTLAKKDYGLVQSIPAGITRGVESIDSYLS